MVREAVMSLQIQPVDGDVTTDPEVAAAAAALATLARHDATDCAEALGLTAYVGWSRHAGQRAHMVERGPSVPTSPVSRTRVFLRSGTVRAVKVG